MFPGSHAASNPNRPAVVMAGSGKTLTYGQLDDNSARSRRHCTRSGCVLAT
jgi:long-chain acyl-CoA synthetase